MKPFRIFSMVALLLFYVQTGNVFAQLGLSAAKVAVNGAMLLMGGNRQAKQEKIIDQSSQKEKISGSNVTVLRVKDSDIKSKAKKHIIALQNRLDQYNNEYKNNQPIDIPKNDSDLTAIQDADENWPVEDYISELRAYKRYAFQQKQKMAAAAASLNATPNAAVKKDSTGAKQ